MGFSDRLKAIIKRSGLKREEFAGRTGVSRRQLFNYIGSSSTPTGDFFQAVKEAFPWVNIEWLITGIGEMEARGNAGVHQVASGNGNVQVGGHGTGQAVWGNNNQVKNVGGVPRDQESETAHTSQNRDLVELVDLLKDYGSPKLIAELRDKLLQIKKAVEGV